MRVANHVTSFTEAVCDGPLRTGSLAVFVGATRLQTCLNSEVRRRRNGDLLLVVVIITG